jgi:hypothetical protein
MAGAPDAPSPNFFGKPSAKRPKRSPAKAVKRYHQYCIVAEKLLVVLDVLFQDY